MSYPGMPYQAQDAQNPNSDAQQWAQDFFIYSVSFGNLAPAASSLQNVQIQADANFEWVQSTCFGFLHGATAPFTDNALLPINVTIVDSGSARQLFSAPIPLTTFAGTGKQPFILPVTKIFQARANIQVTAQNFDPTNTYDSLVLTFIGRKLFNLGPH